MAGTVRTDLNSLTLTATALAAGRAKATDLEALRQLAIKQASETTATIKALQSFHPSGGGDAANFALLTTILGELV